jgi:hypothetical protein
MADLIKIPENNLISAPNVNLLPQFAMFNDVFTWNVASGSATAININQQQLDGDRCLRIVPNSGATTVVNSGGNQMQTTVVEDGNYIFSIREKSVTPTQNIVQIAVIIYVNGVGTEYSIYASDEETGYNTYYQAIQLLADDVVDFAFKFYPTANGGSFKHYFDAPKLEIDQYGLGTPTVFSLPESRTTQVTIDLGSISNNSSETVSVSIPGTEVGDFVQMTFPSQLIDLELIVGQPIVYSSGVVKFVVHNHTGGGSIDPNSGTFTFKITK